MSEEFVGLDQFSAHVMFLNVLCSLIQHTLHLHERFSLLSGLPQDQ